MTHETINALLAECERDLASLRATLAFAEIRGDSINDSEPFIRAMASTFHRTLAYAARAIKRENRNRVT